MSRITALVALIQRLNLPFSVRMPFFSIARTVAPSWDGGKQLHALTLIASVVDANIKTFFRKLGVAHLRPCFTPMFQRFGTAPVGSGNGVEHKLSVCVSDTVAVLVQLIHPALL